MTCPRMAGPHLAWPRMAGPHLAGPGMAGRHLAWPRMAWLRWDYRRSGCPRLACRRSGCRRLGYRGLSCHRLAWHRLACLRAHRPGHARGAWAHPQAPRVLLACRVLGRARRVFGRDWHRHGGIRSSRLAAATSRLSDCPGKLIRRSEPGACRVEAFRPAVQACRSGLDTRRAMRPRSFRRLAVRSPVCMTHSPVAWPPNRNWRIRSGQCRFSSFPRSSFPRSVSDASTTRANTNRTRGPSWPAARPAPEEAISDAAHADRDGRPGSRS
jgi:hypothetical protein